MKVRETGSLMSGCCQSGEGDRREWAQRRLFLLREEPAQASVGRP